MAFLAASEWDTLQFTNAVNEKRTSPLGIVDAVADSTPFANYISPAQKEKMAELSSLRTSEAPILIDQTPTVVTTPGFSFIPSNLPTSAVYSFTAYDVFSGFRHYASVNDNNLIDAAWQREQVMANVAYQCGITIDGILAARLEERKTQVLAYTTQVSQGDGTYTFNATPDTLEINKAAQKETMFYNLETLMAANDLGGQYRLVTSRGGLAVQRSEAAKYAANNDKNLQALGFLDQSRLYEDSNIAAGSDVFNGWFLRDGSIGMIPNFPYDFRKGTELGDGKKWSISNTEIPFARLRANIYHNEAATDATALVASGTDSNLIMTSFEEMAIWFRFYVIYPYNSNLGTRAQDIVDLSGKTA